MNIGKVIYIHIIYIHVYYIHIYIYIYIYILYIHIYLYNIYICVCVYGVCMYIYIYISREREINTISTRVCSVTRSSANHLRAVIDAIGTLKIY